MLATDIGPRFIPPAEAANLEVVRHDVTTDAILSARDDLMSAATSAPQRRSSACPCWCRPGAGEGRHGLLLTPCVLGSGIMLAVAGPSFNGQNSWLEIHRISFIAWAFFVTIHALTYVWRLPRLLAAEARGVWLEEDPMGGPRLPGGSTRAGRRKSSAAAAPGWPC